MLSINCVRKYAYHKLNYPDIRSAHVLLMDQIIRKGSTSNSKSAVNAKHRFKSCEEVFAFQKIIIHKINKWANEIFENNTT